ncbi:hypothetical protein J6590_047129 [Homalodisca vitripennis]|nr:hypothetical protein J6590_047129 [Homalodisca vitripennis]
MLKKYPRYATGKYPCYAAGEYPSYNAEKVSPLRYWEVSNARVTCTNLDLSADRPYLGELDTLISAAKNHASADKSNTLRRQVFNQRIVALLAFSVCVPEATRLARLTGFRPINGRDNTGRSINKHYLWVAPCNGLLRGRSVPADASNWKSLWAVISSPLPATPCTGIQLIQRDQSTSNFYFLEELESKSLYLLLPSNVSVEAYLKSSSSCDFLEELESKTKGLELKYDLWLAAELSRLPRWSITSHQTVYGGSPEANKTFHSLQYRSPNK